MRFDNIVKIVGGAIAIAVVLGMILAYCGFSLTDIITMLSAMVVAVSAATTAYFAYKGLSIWKEQHSGKIEFDLATRLLVSVYKYRDAMDDYIRPFIYSIRFPYENVSDIREEYQPLQVYINLEKERYDKIDSASQEIYADIPTSEASWGNEMRLIFLDMSIQAEEIRGKVITQLSEISQKIKNKKLTKKQEVQELLDKEKLDRAISEEFFELVKQAEDYLKEKKVSQNPSPPPQPNTKKGTK